MASTRSLSEASTVGADRGQEEQPAVPSRQASAAATPLRNVSTASSATAPYLSPRSTSTASAATPSTVERDEHSKFVAEKLERLEEVRWVVNEAGEETAPLTRRGTRQVKREMVNGREAWVYPPKNARGVETLVHTIALFNGTNKLFFCDRCGWHVVGSVSKVLDHFRSALDFGRGGEGFNARICTGPFTGQDLAVIRRAHDARQGQRHNRATEIQRRHTIATGTGDVARNISSELRSPQPVLPSDQHTVVELLQPCNDEVCDRSILEFAVMFNVRGRVINSPQFQNVLNAARRTSVSYKPPEQHCLFNLNPTPQLAAGATRTDRPPKQHVLYEAHREVMGNLVQGVERCIVEGAGLTLQYDGADNKAKDKVYSFVLACPAKGWKWLLAMFNVETLPTVDNVVLQELLRKALARIEGPEGLGRPVVTMLVSDGGAAETKCRRDFVASWDAMEWDDVSKYVVRFESRCLAHGFNLLIKGIGNAAFRTLFRDCQGIINFILEHHAVKHEWKSLQGVKALHKPADTRFATHIHMVSSFLADEVHIVALWMSHSLRTWSRSQGGDLRTRFTRYSADCIQNQEWWRALRAVEVLSDPLMKAIRVADSGKPNLSSLCVQYERDCVLHFASMLGQTVNDKGNVAGDPDENVFWPKYQALCGLPETEGMRCELLGVRFDNGRSIYELVKDVILPEIVARRQDCVPVVSTAACFLDCSLQYAENGPGWEPWNGFSLTVDLVASKVKNPEVQAAVLRGLQMFKNKQGPFALAGQAYNARAQPTTFWGTAKANADCRALADLFAIPLSTATAVSSDVERSFKEMNQSKTRLCNGMQTRGLEARMQCRYAWSNGLMSGLGDVPQTSAMARCAAARAEQLDLDRQERAKDRLLQCTKGVLECAAHNNTEFGEGLRPEVLSRILSLMKTRVGEIVQEAWEQEDDVFRGVADMEISEDEDVAEAEAAADTGSIDLD